METKFYKLHEENKNFYIANNARPIKLDGYNEDFYYAQDYELWFRILHKFKGANLHTPLTKRRKHKDTLTKRKINMQSYFSFKACKKGRKIIKPKLNDELHILKYKIISKTPAKLLFLIDKFRLHNLKYYYSGYYIRN